MKLFASACIATALIGFTGHSARHIYQNYFFPQPDLHEETLYGLGINTQESQLDLVTKAVRNEPKMAKISTQYQPIPASKWNPQGPSKDGGLFFWAGVGFVAWGMWKISE